MTSIEKALTVNKLLSLLTDIKEMGGGDDSIGVEIKTESGTLSSWIEDIEPSDGLESWYLIGRQT